MNYTDEQLKAAIDAAFYHASGRVILTTVVGDSRWDRQREDRLAIARAFLAELGKLHPDAQEKPAWTLPPPPAGHKWHRDDWTEDMLPEGYRPLLNGELIEKSDEVWQFAEGPWKNESIAVGLTGSSRNHHFRTCRPLPSWSQASAELIQKAEASGVDLDAQPSEEPAWIPHDGGPCPLKDDEVEEWQIKYADGDTRTWVFKPSEGAGWQRDTRQYAFYRVLKWKPGHGPQAKSKQETSEEAKAANLKAFNEFQDELHATWENADKQPWQPAPGDVVRLKSGGPEMTVLVVVDSSVSVIWAPNSEKIEAADIPTACLQPVTKDRG